jgi:hypothetical protein
MFSIETSRLNPNHCAHIADWYYYRYDHTLTIALYYWYMKYENAARGHYSPPSPLFP